MFDNIPEGDVSSRIVGDSCGPLREFFRDHREAMESAAELLGGAKGAKLATEIAEELSRGGPVSRRCQRGMDNLIALLTLEHVADLRRDEAAFFATIDPSSPVVKEICLLTDMFRNALDQADLDQPQALRSGTAA